MNLTDGIFFEELSANPADFIEDLRDPKSHHRRDLPAASVEALRRQQVERIEKNMEYLRGKQGEFNRKMEDYIRNLRSLVAKLRAERPREPGAAIAPHPLGGGTHVKCNACGAEKIFNDLLVIAARDSLESITQPTELIVDDQGTVRKGTFRCPGCGNGHLMIKDLTPHS